MAKFKVGDVVRMLCHDPTCNCMKDSPPAVIVEVREGSEGSFYFAKFPFEECLYDWQEKDLELLHRQKGDPT